MDQHQLVQNILIQHILRNDIVNKYLTVELAVSECNV